VVVGACVVLAAVLLVWVLVVALAVVLVVVPVVGGGAVVVVGHVAPKINHWLLHAPAVSTHELLVLHQPHDPAMQVVQVVRALQLAHVMYSNSEHVALQ